VKVRRLTDIRPLNEVKALARLAETAERNGVKALKHNAVEAEPLSDSDIFLSLIGPVRKFAPTPTPAQPPLPVPDAAMSRADEAQVLVELFELPDDAARIDGSEQISYLADGHSPKLLRQLKRGQFRISEEFDLHHLSASIAKKYLHQHLHEARDMGKLCVLVIHGKGLRSGDSGAVLKSMVDFELRRRKDVIAFNSAPAALGGTGAVIILLQRR
jgi:DNA-nicking Smr family endonuclease